MKKFLYWFIATIICSLSISVRADSISIQPSEATSVDSVIGSKNPNSNWGNWIGLNAGEQDNEADIGRILIRFDLPMEVTSASLVLYQWSENSSNSAILNVYCITQDWNELSVTWNNQPSIGDLIGSRPFTANEPNGEKTFVLNASLLQQCGYGIEIRSQNENNDLYRFYSSSATDPNLRPKLVVEYGVGPSSTPAPQPTATVIPSNFVIPIQYQGYVHYFVFDGQSNSSGRGLGNPCATSGELIYSFGNDYKWSVLCEPSDISTNQVDSVSIDTNAGYSAALSFARAMRAAHPDWAIGIINCAKGATSISQWQRAIADDTLYGQCRKRILAASGQGVLSGFVYMQGESDAQNYADASQWSTRFEQRVASLRSDFGDVPIVFLQLGNHPNDATFPYWSLVREQQADIDLPCVTMINADDQSMNGPHFYASGYDVIGIRAANAMEC